jgi:polyisoprenoid-binding protein YceI
MTTKTLPTELTAGTWGADPSQSEASFTVRHAGTSKVHGTAAITEATITIGAGLWTSSVTAVLDAVSIDTRDAGRDEHVKGADFFDVENFRVWTFASTSVTGLGSESVVTGDLMIHGVTREVTLATQFNVTAVDSHGNLCADFTASTEISRKDFGLTMNAVSEAGGVLLSDNVKINLKIQAVKQA